MPVPSNAEQVVLWGLWVDEDTAAGAVTSSGSPATVTLEPVALPGQGGPSPLLRDAVAYAHISTRTRTATVNPTTGYFAVLALATNDPDLDAYGGRKVTFSGYPSYVVTVPYTAPTTTVTTAMAAAIPTLTAGASVRALWIGDAPSTTSPPAPVTAYYTADQVNSLVATALANTGGGGGSGSPTGGAGGVLSGSYPNPGFALDMATQAELDTAIATRQALDADLTTIAALDATQAGAIASDGAGWLRKTWAQVKTALALTKTDVGLGSVDNTADTAKPVSTAQQTALNAKVNTTDASVTNARGWSLYGGGSPTSGQVPAWNGSAYVPSTVSTGGSVADATSGAKGVVQLAGDLAGSAAAPTVPGLAAKAGMFTQVALKTAAYTAQPYEIVPVDTTGGSFAVTSPAGGAPFGIRWKAGTTGPTVTAATGYTINGNPTVTPSLQPGTSSGELITWQVYAGTDYQTSGGFKPQSALDAAMTSKALVFALAMGD